MAEPNAVSDATFSQDVLKSKVPVVVDFWAPWCGPCRMVAPVVEQLAGEYDGKVNFAKLNTDENPLVCGQFGIRSIPTLIMFKNGEEFSRIVGFKPKADFKKQIDSMLP